MSEPQATGPTVEFMEMTLQVVIGQRNFAAQQHAEALARALVAEKRLAEQAADLSALRVEFEAVKAKVLGELPQEA